LKIMKVAIPIDEKKGLDSSISPDYSRCKFFVISVLDDDRIVSSEFMSRELPEAVAGVAGAAAFLLAGKGVEAVVVQSIEERERIALAGNAIRIFVGARGTAFDALRQLIDDRLEENSSLKGKDACSCEGDCG
jgi:predicted Fe-Mo cluster-binding NifX family protein